MLFQPWKIKELTYIAEASLETGFKNKLWTDVGFTT